MIWFTSDLHLRHENIIRYANRPFADADEMGRAIVENINERVAYDDTLWILGDVCMGREKLQGCESLVNRLVCRDVRLVCGNHDARDHDRLSACGFASVSDYAEISLGGHEIAVLSHYPMLSWNRMRHGSYMLHGHIHAGPEYNERNRADGVRRYDVGVDANGYAPVSKDDIKAFFRGTEPTDPFMTRA